MNTYGCLQRCNRCSQLTLFVTPFSLDSARLRRFCCPSSLRQQLHCGPTPLKLTSPTASSDPVYWLPPTVALATVSAVLSQQAATRLSWAQTLRRAAAAHLREAHAQTRVLDQAPPTSSSVITWMFRSEGAARWMLRIKWGGNVA